MTQWENCYGWLLSFESSTSVICYNCVAYCYWQSDWFKLFALHLHINKVWDFVRLSDDNIEKCRNICASLRFLAKFRVFFSENTPNNKPTNWICPAGVKIQEMTRLEVKSKDPKIKLNKWRNGWKIPAALHRASQKPFSHRSG